MKPHNKHAAANIKTGGYGEDTKLDLKNSSWQQRISDSDFTCIECSPKHTHRACLLLAVARGAGLLLALQGGRRAWARSR